MPTRFERLREGEYCVHRLPGKPVATDPDGRVRDRFSDEERDRWLACHANVIRWLSKVEPKGRLLDWGCGMGHLGGAVGSGWTYWGVDPDEGLNALQHPEQCDDEFECVVLNHVLEHVADPARMLRRARGLCHEGLLIVGTPDFDSVAARHQGDAYRLLHDPTHISLFSEESMRRCLQDTGWRIQAMERPYWGTPWEESPPDITRAYPGNFLTFYAY